MKYALLGLLIGCALSGCSGDPDAGFGQTPNVGGAAGASGASAGGVSASVDGSAGAPTSGGSALGGSPSGGASPGGAGSSSAGSGGVSGGAGTAGAAGASSCTPTLGGAVTVTGDVVHDASSCLDWMKTTQDNVNYAAAETFCGEATTGGFDDWRIPSVDELASIITHCGKYPPEGPVDTQVFDIKGDGYWTQTPAGEPNKVCAIGMANAGGYYHYGTAGPQVVRCVRGLGITKAVKDCTVAQGCSSW